MERISLSNGSQYIYIRIDRIDIYNYVCTIIEDIYFRKDCSMCSVDILFLLMYTFVCKATLSSGKQTNPLKPATTTLGKMTLRTISLEDGLDLSF